MTLLRNPLASRFDDKKICVSSPFDADSDEIKLFESSRGKLSRSSRVQHAQEQMRKFVRGRQHLKNLFRGSGRGRLKRQGRVSDGFCGAYLLSTAMQTRENSLRKG